MKKLFSLSFLIYLTGASIAYATAITDVICPFDRSKVEQAVQTMLVNDYLPQVSFWNKTPPAVKCIRQEDGVLCKATFAAMDGTSFCLSNELSQTFSMENFDLVADNEGNFVRPLTCRSALPNNVAIYNRKTRVGIPSPSAGWYIDYLK
jgi:hypothetical protein